MRTNLDTDPAMMAIVAEVNGWVYEVSSNEHREMLVAFARELFGEPITVLDADSDIATASKRR